jgi:4-hydroxy-tetrahydrodipicolinate synthase
VSQSAATKSKFPFPLSGVVPPVVTPLMGRASLDANAFCKLINRLIESGVHGLFLLGTTGEFCSLSGRTQRAVIDQGCAAAAGRVPIVVNVSHTSLDESVRLAKYAWRAGAGAVAICPPFYFPVTQNDLVRSLTKFARRVPLPVFLYNIPQNAGVEFEVETVGRLAEEPNIVGVKNSNGRLDYLAELKHIKQQRPSFSLLVGTEEIMLSSLAAGADGSVCGGANMFPHLYMSLYRAAVEGQNEEAERLQDLVTRVAEAVYTIGFSGTSYFRGLKATLAYLGVCNDLLAEPLERLNDNERQELHERLAPLLPEIPERK